MNIRNLVMLLLFLVINTLMTTQKSFASQEKILNICNTIKISTCVAKYHPLKNLIAVASYDTALKLVDADSGQILKTLVHPAGTPSVDFNASGNKLVSGSYDHQVRIWDINTGELEQELHGHKGNVFAVAYNPKENIVASAGANGQVIIWHLATGKKTELSGHDGDVWGITFSPDGSTLLTGGEDNKIKLWNVNTGDLVQELTDHSGAVLALKFSHDGNLLASGGDDYSIKLWDTKSWRNIHTFKGEFYSVYSLDFSKDDKILASSGRDKSSFGEFFQHHFDSDKDKNDSVYFWDLTTKTERLKLAPHFNDTNSISFNHDGSGFVTSSIDGNVIIHKTPF